MSLSAWLDIWLEDYCGDKKWSTVKHYRAQVETHIKPSLGALKLSELTPKEIQHFYNQLSKNGRIVNRKDSKGKKITEKKPLAAKSVRNIHGVLTKALSVAVSQDCLRSNPCARVTLPRVEKKEIVPLPAEQVKALLAAAADDELFGAIIKVITFSGMREAEAAGLTWDCVDFKENAIEVKKQLQKRPLDQGGFRFVPLKNDKRRTVNVALYAMDVLKQRQLKQQNDRLKAGELWEGWSNPKEQEKALVFTNELGQHIHPQTIYRHFKKLAKQIGCPNARVHDLRHTFAVLSLQNGDSIKTVQENLGHATAAFTLDVYGHVSEHMRKESAARMQALIDDMKMA